MAQSSGIDYAVYKQLQLNGYSKVAGNYAKDAVRVTSQVNEPLLNAVRASRGNRLLDVACGPGQLSADAAKRGCVVTGIDFAEPMVMIARSSCPAAEFHVGDAECLPFEADKFDAVVCSLAILHFPNPEQAISEAKRVLVSGGYYAFTSWAAPARSPFFRLVLGSAKAHGTMDLPIPRGPNEFRFGEPAECERTLRECGLEVVLAAEVPINWDFATPEQIIPTLIASSASMGPIFSLQKPQQRINIERAIIDGAKAYCVGNRIAIPGPMVMALARKV